MRQLAELDRRRNVNSRKTFKYLYKETNHG